MDMTRSELLSDNSRLDDYTKVNDENWIQESKLTWYEKETWLVILIWLFDTDLVYLIFHFTKLKTYQKRYSANLISSNSFYL